MFTIGQVSEMFHIPISTLRYYDKEGLFPNMERASGIRRFGETELKPFAPARWQPSAPPGTPESWRPSGSLSA